LEGGEKISAHRKKEDHHRGKGSTERRVKNKKHPRNGPTSVVDHGMQGESLGAKGSQEKGVKELGRKRVEKI